MGLVVVINEKVQDRSIFKNIKEFCLATPRGAYTTAQVKEDFFIAEWQLHIERLIKSIAAIHAHLNACFESHYAKLERHVRFVYSMIDAVDHHDPNQMSKSMQTSLSEAAVIQLAVLQSLLLALTTAASTLPPAAPKAATIVIAPSESPDIPFDVHVAVALAPSKTAIASPSDDEEKQKTFATILGPPRDIPIGKDSGWVEKRQYLENMRPEGAAEILLTTKNGEILEGLVTNFFVISSDDKNGNLPILETAGMESGVVWGTMRQRVLRACQELGVKVLEQPPNAVEREYWQEAFLTNALRGVQALDRIECGESNVWDLDPWNIEFHAVPGLWTSRIKEKVESYVEYDDVRQLVVE